MIKTNCKICNKEIIRRTDKNKSGYYFCSKQCLSTNFKISKPKTQLPCNYCSKLIFKTDSQIKNYKHHFCSLNCCYLWKSKNLIKEKSCNWKGGKLTNCCNFCQKIFKTRKSNSKYCSTSCYHKQNNKKISYHCKICDKLILVTPSTIKWKKIRNSENFFCSVKCAVKFKQKENHPMWKKDRSKIKNKNKSIRESQEMIEWRTKVYMRDNYTCQICKRRGGLLNAHHIKKFCDYPELRFDINNGITLCEKHHNKTKNKEELFEQLFLDMLNYHR